MSKFTISNIQKPLVMGILNVTPDSFSDGGRFATLDSALFQAEKLIAEGADILDIGGESTRPGAPAVSEQEELERVIPVIEKIKQSMAVSISLDTSKAVVMEEGLKAGIDLINDVSALSLPGALKVAASSTVPICLMHMQGSPRTMQTNPIYNDVVADVYSFFEDKIAQCESAGIERERLVLDPGFGFGKTLGHNFELLNHLDRFGQLGLPVLAGLSRKSMLGKLLNLETEQRTNASVVAATLAMTKGAQIMRVHDVAETKQAVEVYHAMTNGVISE
jgi:dihydropteroate synthase